MLHNNRQQDRDNRALICDFLRNLQATPRSQRDRSTSYAYRCPSAEVASTFLSHNLNNCTRCHTKDAILSSATQCFMYNDTPQPHNSLFLTRSQHTSMFVLLPHRDRCSPYVMSKGYRVEPAVETSKRTVLIPLMLLRHALYAPAQHNRQCSNCTGPGMHDTMRAQHWQSKSFVKLTNGNTLGSALGGCLQDKDM